MQLVLIKTNPDNRKIIKTLLWKIKGFSENRDVQG